MGDDDDIDVDDFPDWVDVLTSNDFTGDGKTDYIVSGSEYCNVLALYSDTDSDWDDLELEDILWIDGSQEGRRGKPRYGVGRSSIDHSGYCALTSGDYDQDGDNDFLFLVSHSSSPYGLERIWLYQNGLVEDGYVHFSQTDLTAAWGSTLGGIKWTSSPMSSVDFDQDGDIDILIGNLEGQVFWAENIGSEVIDGDTFVLESDPLIETGWGGRGITVLAAADFDQDDDTDVVVGSVSRQKLRFYENPGTDLFGGGEDIGDDDDEGDWGEKFAGAAAFHVCRDFDGDGYPDLLVGTDAFNYRSGIGGRVYHFDYRLWDRKFLVRRILTLPRSGGDDDAPRPFPEAPEAHGPYASGPYVSGGTGLFWGGLPSDDDDGVRDLDFIAWTDNTGDGIINNIFAGDHYIGEDDDAPAPLPTDYPPHGPSPGGRTGDFRSDPYPLPPLSSDDDEGDERVEVKALPIEETNYYNIHALAESNVVAPLCEQKNLITKVVIKDIEQGILGRRKNDISLTYYVSNNGGSAWYQVESFSNNNINDKSGKVKEIKFKDYGSQLCWKAVFIAEGDEVSRGEFIGASLCAPYIDGLTLEYYYVEEMEFSRASAAATAVKVEGSTKNIVIAPSFVFPSWEGHLRAYDVTSMSFEGESSYGVKTLSAHDPHEATGRDIQADNTTLVWDADEILNLRSAESRKIYTAIPEDPKVGPFNRLEFKNQNYDQMKKYFKAKGNIIDFIRGENRDFKLGWIDHSTPLVVNPPSGDDSILGHDYQTFEDNWAGRGKMVLVASNGGMLHCFNAADGDELWAFVPFCCLKELKKIGKKNKTTGFYDFNPKGEVYVDGNPAAENVYIDTDGDGSREWTTLLICGNGKGKGKGLKDQKGKYFFFALDITDPDDPRPLWEIGLEHCGYTEKPAQICRVLWEDEERWVAFMSSGADKGEPRLFCVDVETGDLLWTFKGEGKGMAAAPSVYDIDDDGFMDRVYIGDLKGNMWRVDLTESLWEAVAIYRDKNEFPISTKAAVWKDKVTGETTPHVYFGTGGSDEAKDDKEYGFIALLDSANPEIQWYMGNVKASKSSIKTGDFEEGEKIWSDPVIADEIVYFSTFKGNIEDVDPVEDSQDPGKLYARFINLSAGSLLGTTSLSEEAEYLALSSKTNTAFTAGGTREYEGTEERDIWINEYDSTLQVLSRGGGTLKEHPDSPGGGGLKIRSWREVREIIKN
jgi:hypothetical protein